MATAYLTDAAVWITICAARLQEIAARVNADDAENTAADLYDDPEYGDLDPALAAEAWQRGRAAGRRAA